MKEAPLFIDAYDLHSWLVDRLEGQEGLTRVGETALAHSARLLEAVALAVARFDTADRLVQADEEATVLRVHLRLAADKRLLDDRQLLHANKVLQGIGRQIGGWRKKLERVG